MGMAAFLFSGAEPLNKLSIPLRQKAPYEIWWKLVKQFQKKAFKDYKFCYFSHTLYVSAISL